MGALRSRRARRRRRRRREQWHRTSTTSATAATALFRTRPFPFTCLILTGNEAGGILLLEHAFARGSVRRFTFLAQLRLCQNRGIAAAAGLFGSLFNLRDYPRSFFALAHFAKVRQLRRRPRCVGQRSYLPRPAPGRRARRSGAPGRATRETFDSGKNGDFSISFQSSKTDCQLSSPCRLTLVPLRVAPARSVPPSFSSCCRVARLFSRVENTPRASPAGIHNRPSRSDTSTNTTR